MLPQNRRLRHLQGIYLRNLSFARPQGRAIDDLDADLQQQQQQQQLLLHDGQSQLHHAHSSESLRPRSKARRRSTNLANASPVTRQKRLEFTLESRAADVFLSLHCDAAKDPIYISEVVERSMNFNFRFFELSQAGPSVTRLSQLRVKVWAKRRESWTLLLTQDIDLRSLNYLGSLRNHHFPPNCLIFHLVDGVYALDVLSKRPEPKQTTTLPTSSYNALMKLSNLDNSIQDALATREALTSQINQILERMPPNPVPQAQESALVASKYVSSQRRALRAAQARRTDLQASIDARRNAIKEGRAAQSRAAADVEHAQSKIPASQSLLASTRESIHGQRRRICEDLTRIFPINPTSSGAPLAFSICGIPLPNTDYDPTSSSAIEESLSAGLGYVAQLTNALQFYLSVPLPYPVTPFGSRSSVRDDISLLPDTQQREFPLFLRGGATAQYRFDYGWFLLNKDIEALCVAVGLKVVDIRHTLPNLKYLLYVCSAGSDEVPERKRGGIRGLWTGRMKNRGGGIAVVAAADDASSAGTSRRGSVDSEVAGSKQREQLNRAIKESIANENGCNYDHSVSSTTAASGSGSGRGGGIRPSSPLGLPFGDEDTKLTLRTKGLRENVGAIA
ncbi:UV radiation resistance protein and autophagy-related subunit 14-domain-containing protein [Biscogniauxia sp. FL1348]|nr:UV radiation resistance protein and autophagy-related subunit 14-domain-containing protein [Biscogniauxia sp. FL1348]